MPIKIGLDIDGTITADTDYFAELAASTLAEGGEVHVVTSRDEQARNETTAELKGYGLRYTALHFIPPMSAAKALCSHAQLGWYDQWLWGKVAYALENKIAHFVDDDPKVETLFLRYAAEVYFSLFSSKGDAELENARAVIRKGATVRGNGPLKEE